MTTNAKDRITTRNATEIISRLQRGVLRLALSFHGQNPALDSRLKRLGVLVRNGRRDEELQRLIDETVDTIVSEKMAQNPDQRGGTSLINLLERIQVDGPRAASMESIRRRLGMPLDKHKLDETITEAAQILNDLIPPPADAQTNPRRGDGAFKRLLDQLEAPHKLHLQIQDVRERIAESREDIQLIKAAEDVAAAISNALSSDDARRCDKSTTEAREQLMRLVELIPVPAELADEAAAIKRAIEKTSDAAELYHWVPQIADLTASMRDQLQAEVDEHSAFLKQIIERLLEFEKQFQQSSRLHQESSTNVANLSRDMKIHVNELRDEVINGEDLEQLKRAVSAHLDTIDENLQSFVQTESDRQRTARRTIDTMVEKLQDLESEAEELRENLEEQQAKVVIDPLTGILNRTGYLASINKEFARWRRYSGDLSLAVVDLDLFKQINDRYGHAAGDKVLATVAAQLKSQIRECDYLCRYGGEEFVLVLPETDSNAGFAMLDKLRAYIESCNFHYKETPVPVTLSCGIAQFHRGDKIEEVFDRADRAMYLAKQAGRNRCAQESLETAELA